MSPSENLRGKKTKACAERLNSVLLGDMFIISKRLAFLFSPLRILTKTSANSPFNYNFQSVG